MRPPRLRRFFTHTASYQNKRVKDPSYAPKVTRKKYSELPKQQLLKDGRPAMPMPAWDGGLHRAPAANELNSAVNSTRHGCPTGTVRDLEPCNFFVAEPLEGRRLSPSNEPGAEPSPVRRKRKVKANIDPVNGPEIISKPIAPRNALATEILQNLEKFSHCILLTRVGQFYESYFDQAAEVAQLLHIKLTHRTWDKQRVLMCGFPLGLLDKYLKILVQQHKRFVAMCEEFPRPPSFSVKDGFDRRVIRVITPGTLIDESFLNPYENNYLLAIHCTTPDAPLGLAWIDVSTGEFFSSSSACENFRDELARISPREIVLDKNMEVSLSHPVRKAISEEGSFVSYAIPSDTELPVPAMIPRDHTDDLVPPIDAPSPTFEPYETSAIKLLTTFLRANLLERMPVLSSPSKDLLDGRMQIDSHTIKALEIRESIIEGGTSGSLLSVIKRTKTTGGTRLLARWLCSPSASITEINARQSLVSFLHARPHLREDLVAYLSEVDDVSRIVQKFILGRGEPCDLASIHSSISLWELIKKRFQTEQQYELQENNEAIRTEWASVNTLLSKMIDLSGLSTQISSFLYLGEDQARTPDTDAEELVVELPDASRNGVWRWGGNKWAIKPECSELLSNFHADLKVLLDRRDELERNLQRTYAAPSLTLRSSPGQGMHVHIQKSKRNQTQINTDPLFLKLTEKGSTATYFYHEWSKLGNQILEVTSAICAAERDVFDAIRNDVIASALQLRRNARVLDELDVTISFANLAQEMKFVRPILVEHPAYDITNGRHPAVEFGLLSASRVFIPNSVSLTPESRIHVLTGPNMGGKSTLLRQTAVLAILAQIGCFVPAERAVIGIVDRLFSRVGAKDDLFRDRSTFMVEMLETAAILKHATERSLVIMDEVGRGTTVTDGLAIAFATIHHLLAVNKCRSLFATHFHELSDMLGYSANNKGSGFFQDVAFFCTGVDETEDGRFAYAYSLRPGVNRDSHGLKVAQLAGLPATALSIAREALQGLRSRAGGTVIPTTSLRDLGLSLTSANSRFQR